MARTKQTARKSSKPKSSKGSKLADPSIRSSNPDAVYPAQTIVAFIDENTAEGYALAQLQDDALESEEDVQVTLLQETDQAGDSICYTASIDGEVKIDRIIRDLPYKVKHQRGRNNPDIYHIERVHMDGLSKLAADEKKAIKTNESKEEKRPKKKKKDESESSESESESDEGESSEDSGEQVGEEKIVFVEDTPRVLKRVKGRKSSAKKKKESSKKNTKKDELSKSQKKEETIQEEEKEESDNEEEEEEEEEKPAPKRGRGRPGKSTGVSRASKKKVSEVGGSATKKIEFDSEEEESSDEDEDKGKKKGKEEEKEDKKKKRKPQSTQRKPVKTVPDTYKKGKFNTKVEVLTHHDLLQNKSNTPIDYGCTTTNNKNLIRAVATQNYTLLQNILEKKHFLSSLHEQWGPENDTTALSLAIKNKDVKAVKLILDCEYGRNYNYASETEIKLENVDTGNVSKTAFGVEIRKVNLMRGAREGNNAFTHDMETHSFDFDSLFELPMTKEILDYLRSKAGNNRVIPNIHKLILAGDRVNAGYLVNLANSVGGYGFNYLHEEALLKDKPSDLTPNIKRVSVTKKVIGNSVITPLHCAAINPNPEILNALLQIAPDYSIPDEKMRKLIHYAACCEKPGPLKLLISKGVDPREKDHTGLTPFMYACYYGRAENVEYLLKEAKVDPHMKTKDGMMGAHWAALKGHLGVLKILVENEVKMSAKGGKSKMTPLHFAAAYGYYDCVEYLIEHKSRVLAKDKFKRSPLCVAVRNGNLQIASYLLYNGSDFEQADSSNNYPLHYAAAYGFTECIDILVKAGADVNVTNSWKLTALTVAMLKSNFHCVKALLAYPATDVNAKDDQGRSLVSLLIDDPSDENFERIAFLIKERNCDVNTGDEDGLAPLHYACQLQADDFGLRKITRQLKYTQRAQAIWKAQKLKMQLIRLLLEVGADVNARTKDDQFPLLFAITNFDKELIELLIEQPGIDIAFHDGDLNNFYRLLYSHTLDSDDNREFLKRILQKVGNVSNLLNEEKNDVIKQGDKKIKKNQSKHPRGRARSKPKHSRARMAKRSNYDSDDSEEEEDDDSEEQAHVEEEGEENNELMEADPTAFEPTSCNESAFTCYKRTLMNHMLQNYLETEQNNTLEAKRQKIINEEREKQKQLRQNNPNDYYGGGSHFSRSNVPSYAEIKLTEEEIAEYKERAYNQFDEVVTKNLDLIGEFVKAGGMLPLAEALLTREEYSNDPRFMIWVLESFKTDLNLPDEDGNTAIFHLIARKDNLQMTPNGKVALVSYLTSQGLNADTIATYSDFRLFLEVYHRFGANFNFRNKEGVTPILSLLKSHDKKNAGFLEDLVAYGADVHQAKDNDGSTAFLEAVYAEDLKVMKKLAELEADINHKDKKGKAPLHYISEMRLVHAMDAAHIVVKLKNIDIDIRDEENARTPLMYSILKGARGLAKIFLQAGADANKTDKDWCNSLYFATQVGDAVLMREVSETIQDPTFSGFGGFSPLHLAIQNGSEEHVEALLKIGANPNAKDNTGRTALMAAVISERLEIVKILLENGGNPNERDETEKTCLHYAVNNSKPEQMFEMEDVLIRNNADINAVDMYGRSPLHYAFIPIEGNSNFHNQNDPVETVTSLGTMETVNVNLKDRRGKTPLHYAAENGAYICVLLLLKKEVAFDEPDADGNTPLALSLNAGHKDTAAILIQNKANVTNMIHRINHHNYLWVHPKDKNYDDLVGPDGQLIQKKDDQEVTTEKEGGASKSKKERTEKMEVEQQEEIDIEEEERENAEEEHNGDIDEEEQEEKEEEEEEDEEEGGTEDLDQEDVKAREIEIQDLESPIEDLDEEEIYERKLPVLNLGQVQRPVDSFFAISIRKGWQGIAYLLLQNGFNLMEAIRDALNEHQFKYVVALMTKVQDEVVRKTDHNDQNLFHIFAMKGQRAPLDLAKKIFDGLMKREVDYKIFDSFGRAPIHYAAENNFVFLEDKLLENKVDPNILDQKGYSVLHLAAKTNNLSVDRLRKFDKYHVDINTKFHYHGKDITALHHIAERGAEDVEKEMLKLGADPNMEDSEGFTPIQRVFMRKRLSTDRIKIYIKNKTDINKIFTVKERHGDKENSKTYTLLIYAAEKGWHDYEDVLLNHGGDASIINSENKTAFEIALHHHSSLTLEKLRLYILCLAPLRKPISCKIRRRNMNVMPVLYLLNTRENVELVFLKELLDAGVSINDADEDGYTAIVYAIRRNNMPLLKLLLEYPDLDKSMRDKHGKTPIHHVVTPMDYASYENTEMLGVLAAFFDVNTVDDRKKPPIYYAHFQDSGVMKQALLDLGATDNKPSSEIQRQATSIIAGVDWLEEIDFEADADNYIASQEDSKMNTEKALKEPVDDCVHNRHNLQVVFDDELGPYSLYMTKVDIKKGGYGEYVFYRMQVLYDKNRDNYILLTKWGRIGDDGMHQETPFGTKDECINEFLKIFKEKSGNEWKNKAKFQKLDHKFKLLNVSTRKSQNDYLQPIDWDDKKLPPSKLERPIKKIIRSMADVKMYHRYFGRNNIDAKILPFGKLSKETIFEAKKLLLELRELIEEIEGKSNDTDEDVQVILKLKEKIMDKSSKYYELIPDTRFRLSPVEPIEDLYDLEQKVTVVNDMLDFEVAAKILLGSLHHIKVMNPIDYSFEALGIRLLPLVKKQREYKLISQYIKNGYENGGSDFIVNIFALERRGEAERISQWKGEKNRMYLWHGSKLLNFMGILSQGLRIAPPEAPATGYMFGKGIYFADNFSKSYGYCNDHYSRGSDNTKLLVLCEVALGEIWEQKEANYVTKLPAPYNSVLGRGSTGPDPSQNIILANGAIVPLGKQMAYPEKDEKGHDIDYALSYNEYIVYDISQVRMRYLVQVRY